ncbi:rho GTPase-activating protein 25 isoform X1 [Apteryx rowi]|uniref:rho GTPase-activating protein 25 isoform X1 n=1 Tax=Apteryx rowi TaxID=308060 RepID=UPI000E1DB502|nr:rho GTPase-activating protein 25 isoform X1 [Apteryx rowi]
MSLKLPRNWDFNLKMDAAKIARSKSVMTGEPVPAGARPASPNPLERPLKIGWLKKQRSIVKNWQQRYFVLKGQQLYYYKDEDDAKPQGCLSLQGSTIREVAGTLEEGGKFIFEIIPGISGDQNRAGQDPCVLMANSQAEMEEWVKSIRRVLGSASGAVFGQRLVETMAYEQKFGQHQVPILVEKCAEFIREHGMSEEGIFRLPGQDNLVKRLRDAFDAGERPSFDRDTDVHTVASLFKLYLRELPEPVVPWMQYEDFLLCGQVLDADKSKGHQELLKQLSLLPRDNYNLLSYICRFLHEIQLNSCVNKMSVDNLATVIGVNLIRPKIGDPAIIMRGTPQIQKVMTVMISDHADLFPASKDVPPSPPTQKNNDFKKAPVPRSSVGWDAAEDPAVSGTDSLIRRQTRDDLNASSATGPAASSSVPGEDNDVKQSKDPLGMWKMQSRKRTQTLPNRKSFLTAAPQGEKGSNDKSDIFASDFWKSSPGTSVPSGLPDGHKRTLSHDLFKLLDLHRASTYDNVPTSQAESREGSCSSPGTVSSSSDKQFLPSLSHQPKEMASPASSPAEVCDSGQESKEFLLSMILKLEKEMEEQKNNYEEQIKSLEKENYEVWAKVVRLNQDIEREKKKSEDLEQKLINMERSREDMEKKNKMLENEIKNFAQSRSKADAKNN